MRFFARCCGPCGSGRKKQDLLLDDTILGEEPSTGVTYFAATKNNKCFSYEKTRGKIVNCKIVPHQLASLQREYGASGTGTFTLSSILLKRSITITVDLATGTAQPVEEVSAAFNPTQTAMETNYGSCITELRMRNG